MLYISQHIQFTLLLLSCHFQLSLCFSVSFFSLFLSQNSLKTSHKTLKKSLIFLDGQLHLHSIRIKAPRIVSAAVRLILQECQTKKDNSCLLLTVVGAFTHTQDLAGFGIRIIKPIHITCIQDVHVLRSILSKAEYPVFQRIHDGQ